MRIDCRSFPLFAAGVAASIMASASAGKLQHDPGAAAPQELHHDTICGPRCVAYLLTYYNRDRDTDLYEIVRAIQWPEIRDGSTMAGLQNFLMDRGLFTAGVDLPDGHTLAWEHPVVVHLQPVDEGPGHYVVWLPESTVDTAIVWTGRNRNEEIDTCLLAERMNPTVLLTSPEQITDVSAASRMLPEHVLFQMGCLTSFVLAIIVVVVFFGAERTRCRRPGGSAA